MKRDTIKQAEQGKKILAKNDYRGIYASDMDRIYEHVQAKLKEKGFNSSECKIDLMAWGFYFGVYQGYQQRKGEEQKMRQQIKVAK